MRQDQKLAEASSMADGLQRGTQQLQDKQNADVLAMRQEMESMRQGMPVLESPSGAVDAS
jgi:hypothetical protein